MDFRSSNHLENLGKKLLDNFASGYDSSATFPEQPNPDFFNHLNNLSNYLNGIFRDSNLPKTLFLTNTPTLSSINKNKIDVVRSLTADIFQDLKSLNKEPDFKIVNKSSVTESYKILLCALQILLKNQEEKNKKLKNKFDTLQAQYDDILQNVHTNKINQNSTSKSNEAFNSNSFEFENSSLDNSDEKLLKLMSVKYDELNNEMHLLRLKNNDQEREIEKLKQENNNLELEAEHLKMLTNKNDSSLKKDIKIAENTNARIFVLENDVSSLQIRINELNDISEKRKEKIKTLTQIIKEKESSLQAADGEIESLKMKLDKLSLQADTFDDAYNYKEQLEDKEKELSLKNEENQNMQFALNELSNQIEIINKDLSNESRIKNSLFAAVQRQSTILKKYENYVNQLNSNASKNKSTNEDLDKSAFEEELNDEIKKYIIKNYNDHEELINFISSNSDSKAPNKANKQRKQISSINFVKSLITFILDSNFVQNSPEINQNDIVIPQQNPEYEKIIELEKEKNQKLSNYFNCVLKFIDDIANSEEMQSWIVRDKFNINSMYEETFSDDLNTKNANNLFRDNLLKQSARIEAFLHDNNFLKFNNNGNETFNFLKLGKNLFSEMNSNKPIRLDDTVALLQAQITANDFLRKFSEELKIQNTRLISDIRALSSELNEQREYANDKENEINSYKNNVKKLNTALNEQNISPKKIIYKCLQILKANEFNNFDSNDNFNDVNNDHHIETDADYREKTENYINRLEKKLLSLRSKNVSLVEKIKQLRVLMEKQKVKFNEELSQMSEMNNSALQSLTQMNDSQNISPSSQSTINFENTIKEMHKELDEKETEINSLKINIQLLNDQILQEKARHKEILDQLKKEFEAKLAENEKESNTSQILSQKQQKDLEEKIKVMESKMKAQKAQHKAELKKIQTDAEIESQRSKESRAHYEILTQDLKEKLKAFKEKEINEKSNVKKIENELNETKNQLSKARIENRMLTLKIQTSEEKFNRERQLIETQNKMKIMKLQTEKEQEMTTLKEANEMDNHNFLADIYNNLKDFETELNVNFEIVKPVTQETILDLLNQLLHHYKVSNKQLKEYEEKFKIICNELKIKTKREEMNLLSTLREKINASKELDKMKNDVQNNSEVSNKLTTRSWEIWARRLHTLITDSFSTAKSSKELMSAIEETLVSAIGQRQVFRKMEILRYEKKMLLSLITSSRSHLLKSSNGVNNNRLSLFHILAVISAIRRLQRLSGHLKSSFGISSHLYRNQSLLKKVELSNSSQNESDSSPYVSHISDKSRLHDNCGAGNDRKNYPLINFVD